MNSILTISDGKSNGKGGNEFVTFDVSCYIYDCCIVNNNLLINNKKINMNNFTHVIFNFNEDLFTYHLNWDTNLTKKYNNVDVMIQDFKDVATLFKKIAPNVIIYQDPHKCFPLGDKTLTFDTIKDIQNEYVTCPIYKKINNITDLNKFNTFPCIIKYDNGSSTKNDKVCKTKDELYNAYNNIFLNKPNVICIQYIDSKKNRINEYCSIRLMVLNDKLLDYYCRPSKKWNIHTGDQDFTKVAIADEMFQEYYNAHKEYINIYIEKIHSLYGNGFFAYDLILSDNILYVCEIGLKLYDDTLVNVFKNNNIKSNKQTLDKNKMRNLIRNIVNDTQNKNKENKKICFITSCIGRENTMDISSDFLKNDDYDYLIFTNLNANQVKSGWEVINISLRDFEYLKNSVKVSRYFKFMAHEYLKKIGRTYEFVFYCDAYRYPKYDINWNNICDKLEKDESGIIQYKHKCFGKMSINKEMKMIVECKKDTQLAMNNTSKYLQSIDSTINLDTHQYFENTCFGIHMKNKNAINHCNDFWKYYIDCPSYRDQPVWNFIYLKNNTKPYIDEKLPTYYDGEGSKSREIRIYNNNTLQNLIIDQTKDVVYMDNNNIYCVLEDCNRIECHNCFPVINCSFNHSKCKEYGMCDEIDTTKRILVTGCGGFIGSHTCEYLLNNNYVVMGIDNMNDYYDVSIKEKNIYLLNKYKNFSVKKEDIRNTNIISTWKPYKIIHLASMAGVRYSINNPYIYCDVNIKGFIHILQESVKNNVKHIVYASSSSVYGLNNKIPFEENDKIETCNSPYASSKMAMELFAKTYTQLYNISCIGLRFFTVYGPRGRPDMAAYKFMTAIMQGVKFNKYGDGTTYRDYTYIDDIVGGIIGALNNKNNRKCEIYNLGNSTPISLNDLISTCEKIVGKKATYDTIEEQLGDVPHTYASIEKAKKDIDYEPKVKLYDGLNKLYKSLTEQVDDDKLYKYLTEQVDDDKTISYFVV